jgi:hypothetical protein
VKKLKFAILFVILSMLFACEKSLNLELEEKGGKLVLFSFLNPDSAFSVHLSKSVSHMSVDDYERVYDGNIIVYRNGSIVDNFVFPFDNVWAHRNNFKFSAGDTILIKAVDGEGQNVYGKTAVPDAVKVNIKDTATIEINDKEYGNSKALKCNLIISDPVGGDNCYQLVVFEELYSVENGDTICDRSKIDYHKDDPVFYVRDQEGSLIGELDFGGCFSDYLFDGEEYELSLNLSDQYSKAPGSPYAERKLLFVLLSHTRAYYDYYRSRIVAEYGYDLPLIDPIRIYNNVEGGLGLVAAYTASKDSLVFSNQ